MSQNQTSILALGIAFILFGLIINELGTSVDAFPLESSWYSANSPASADTSEDPAATGDYSSSDEAEESSTEGGEDQSTVEEGAADDEDTTQTNEDGEMSDPDEYQRFSNRFFERLKDEFFRFNEEEVASEEDVPKIMSVVTYQYIIYDTPIETANDSATDADYYLGETTNQDGDDQSEKDDGYYYNNNEGEDGAASTYYGELNNNYDSESSETDTESDGKDSDKTDYTDDTTATTDDGDESSEGTHDTTYGDAALSGDFEYHDYSGAEKSDNTEATDATTED